MVCEIFFTGNRTLVWGDFDSVCTKLYEARAAGIFTTFSRANPTDDSGWRESDEKVLVNPANVDKVAAWS